MRPSTRIRIRFLNQNSTRIERSLSDRIARALICSLLSKTYLVRCVHAERKFVCNHGSSLVISLLPLLHTHQCYLNFLTHIMPTRTVACIALLCRSCKYVLLSRIGVRISKNRRVLFAKLGGTGRSTREDEFHRKEAASAIFPRDLRACRCCPCLDNQAIHSDLFHAGER